MDFIHSLGIQDRFLNNSQNTIDYSLVENNLSMQINESKTLLNNIIQLEKVECKK